MRKLVSALTEVAICRYAEKQSLLKEINCFSDKDAREVYIKAFYVESEKYKVTLRDLCESVQIAESIWPEESPVEQLMCAANLAISLNFSPSDIYKAIVDAIDFVFVKQF